MLKVVHQPIRQRVVVILVKFDAMIFNQLSTNLVNVLANLCISMFVM